MYVMNNYIKVLTKYTRGYSVFSFWNMEKRNKKTRKRSYHGIPKYLIESYDSLNKEEKKIYLNIACFSKNEDTDHVIKFFGAKGYNAKIGLSSLVDKGLIVESDNKITMHDFVREMGRQIYQQESMNFPRKCRRLWHYEDIERVSKYNNKVRKKCLTFDMRLNNHFFLKEKSIVVNISHYM